mmetsp:Transcript_21207/g.61199  ORF Transcript_21207/g.61199 Transcript_21207/m.61199 type:complete len:323 (-) Transcript_21207:16-984(-)
MMVATSTMLAEGVCSKLTLESCSNRSSGRPFILAMRFITDTRARPRHLIARKCGVSRRPAGLATLRIRNSRAGIPDHSRRNRQGPCLRSGMNRRRPTADHSAPILNAPPTRALVTPRNGEGITSDRVMRAHGTHRPQKMPKHNRSVYMAPTPPANAADTRNTKVPTYPTMSGQRRPIVSARGPDASVPIWIPMKRKATKAARANELETPKSLLMACTRLDTVWRMDDSAIRAPNTMAIMWAWYQPNPMASVSPPTVVCSALSRINFVRWLMSTWVGVVLRRSHCASLLAGASCGSFGGTGPCARAAMARSRACRRLRLPPRR